MKPFIFVSAVDSVQSSFVAACYVTTYTQAYWSSLSVWTISQLISEAQ